MARVTYLSWEALKLYDEVRTPTDLPRLKAFLPFTTFAKWRFRFLTFTLVCPSAPSS